MDYRDAVIIMHRERERQSANGSRQDEVPVMTVDINKIASNENAAFEARLFAERHRNDFLECARNARIMLQRVLDNAPSRIDPNREPEKIFNADAFEAAFQQLKSEGQLIPPPSILTAGFGDEHSSLPLKDRQRERAETEQRIRESCEMFGSPVTNYAGKVLGYNYPTEWNQPAAPAPKFDGRQSAALRPIVSESPVPEGEKPTRAEFAAFSPAQLRCWLESRGYIGGNIPAEAFRD